MRYAVRGGAEWRVTWPVAWIPRVLCLFGRRSATRRSEGTLITRRPPASVLLQQRLRLTGAAASTAAEGAAASASRSTAACRSLQRARLRASVHGCSASARGCAPTHQRRCDSQHEPCSTVLTPMPFPCPAQPCTHCRSWQLRATASVWARHSAHGRASAQRAPQRGMRACASEACVHKRCAAPVRSQPSQSAARVLVYAGRGVRGAGVAGDLVLDVRRTPPVARRSSERSAAAARTRRASAQRSAAAAAAAAPRRAAAAAGCGQRGGGTTALPPLPSLSPRSAASGACGHPCRVGHSTTYLRRIDTSAERRGATLERSKAKQRTDTSRFPQRARAASAASPPRCPPPAWRHRPRRSAGAA
jgi:hypothetical protein